MTKWSSTWRKRQALLSFLLLNKIDLLADKSKLLPLIAQFQTLHQFKEIVPISALKKKGLDELLACVLKALPNGPRYFPEEQITTTRALHGG